jgi:hypothetical protein
MTDESERIHLASSFLAEAWIAGLDEELDPEERISEIEMMHEALCRSGFISDQSKK